MTKNSNVIDKILDDLIYDTPNQYGYPPDFEPDLSKAKQLLATELVRMVEEVLGEGEKYKTDMAGWGNDPKNICRTHRNQLRAEIRTRLTAIIERELG